MRKTLFVPRLLVTFCVIIPGIVTFKSLTSNDTSFGDHVPHMVRNEVGKSLSLGVSADDGSVDIRRLSEKSHYPHHPMVDDVRRLSKKSHHHHHPLVDPVTNERISIWTAILNYSKCILGAFFVFLGLAIICDDFLCPPIDVLCSRFSIPDDIAGATLLAFGSSAPEIFMNISATASGKVDLSLPAILGSAIIAFGFIPAICSFSVKNPMSLSTWAVVRDAGMFLVCLGLFWEQVSV